MWIRTLVCALGLHGASLASEPALPDGEPVGLMPRAETSFGAEILGGWLYVLGGYHGVPHDYSSEGQSSAFYRMSLLDPRHVELLPDVERVQGAVLVRHDDALVRVGGMRIRNARGEASQLQSLDDCALFEPRSGEWTSLPALPTPRSSHQAEVVGDTLVVVGGWALSGGQRSSVWHDTWLTLDLAAARAGEDVAWQSRPAPFQRRAQAMAATDDGLLVIGGFDGETGRPDGRSWSLDLASGTWSEATALPGDGFAAGFAASAARWQGAVVASGSDGLLQRLDGDGWQPIGRWSFPRFFHELVAEGDELWTLGGIGGMDGSQRLRHVERFDPSSQPSRATAWSVPSPAAARNRQGMALVGRRLYLFGGHDGPGQHDFAAAEFLDEGWVFDLGDLSWRELADYPVARQSMSAVTTADGGRVVMLGGFGVEGSSHGDATTHAEAFVFDTSDEFWEPAGALPVSRSQFGAFLDDDGALWVLGGLDYDPMRDEGDEFRHLTEVVRAEFVDDELQFRDTELRLPEPRRAFGGAVLDGRYYLVGGMREDFQLVETCHVFDPREGSFATIAAPRRTRISPELVAVGDRLVLVGGSSRPRADADLEPDLSVEVYDPARDAWTVLPEALDLPTLKHARAFALDDKLLVVSTHLDDARLELRLLDIGAAPAAAPTTPVETTPEFAAR